MRTLLNNFLPILLVILFFGGSILIHELGHFIAAKRRGMFVPKFSIGFGPKLFGFKYKGTEFVISLLPLGGYVAVPQLADLKEIEGEFELPEGLKQATCSDKVITAFAGPLFNILFAIVLAVAVYKIGLPTPEEMLSTSVGYVAKTLELHDGTEISSPAHEAGLLPNDKILSVDGNKIKRFDDIPQFVALGTNKDSDGNPIANIEIIRNGNTKKIQVKPAIISFTGQKYDKFRTTGIYPKQTLIVENLSKFAEGELSALKKGDKIISANRMPVFHVMALHDITQDNDFVTLEVERNGKLKSFDIEAKKLPIEKPYVSVNFSDGNTVLDIIPAADSAGAFKENTKVKFTKFKLFCSNTNLLARCGIASGDEISSINGQKISTLAEIADALKNSTTASINVVTKFGESTLTVDNISNTRFEGTKFKKFLGIIFEQRSAIDHPTPLQQISDTFTMTFKTLHGLFSKNSDISPKHLMGPAGLIKTLHTFAKNSFPWLLWFVILVNVNLAILNLLPLPVLDGGIITIAVLGKITGWKFIDKIFSKMQTLFFALLLGLIIYVTFFDFKRIFHRNSQSFEMQRHERIAVSYDE